MKVLIIEDEKPAAEKLERLLKKINAENEIVASLPSIKKSVDWLKENNGNQFDLLFLDIQLADGLSFEIFKQVTIDKPIIFTTAYNEYAIEAFKVNSIDYLLKPLTLDALSNSLQKLETLRDNLPSKSQNSQLQALNEVLSSLKKNYKTRFMVKLGEHIKSVPTEKIAYFLADGRNVFLFTSQNRKFIIDYKMEELSDLLQPSMFYRVNRSFVVNINAITDVLVYSNSRLKILTTPETEKEIIVSRDKVTSFKDWFDGFE
ncbi:MAG: LytTR family DNA-binding domain-containing protein [Flammeovirgaceae bacterium]|nr:LytTR family DNA-binding domain-containing protein [Flammeovirgaceae bacterium]